MNVACVESAPPLGAAPLKILKTRSGDGGGAQEQAKKEEDVRKRQEL